MKINSIRSRKIFDEAFKNGTKLVMPSMVLLYVRHPFDGESRLNLGIVVSKKTFNLAVERNFVKRRIRAAFRQVALNDFLGKYNISMVCIGRKKLYSHKFASFVKELNQAVTDVVSAS